MKKWTLFLTLYSLYLFFLVEVFGLVASPYLAKEIVFQSNYFPHKSFRSQEFDPQLGWSNELRLIRGGMVSCFGDSFTFGDGVGAAEVWPALLNQNVTTSNYGVSAYGVDQAYLRAKQNMDNSSSVFILSFISDDVFRNMTIYRPFYQPEPEGGYAMTKPRFALQKGEVKLIANPITRSEDLRKLYSYEFLRTLGPLDAVFQDLERPVTEFPFSRNLWNSNFWDQLYQAYFLGRRLAASRPMDLLKSKRDEIIAVQDYILANFITDSITSGKLPILMHLPDWDEVEAYKLTGEIPFVVDHLQKFCEKKQSHCFFPLLDESLWRGELSQYFIPNDTHYTPLGHQMIAQFVMTKFKENDGLKNFISNINWQNAGVDQ